jgi:hypothetical protein
MRRISCIGFSAYVPTWLASGRVHTSSELDSHHESPCKHAGDRTIHPTSLYGIGAFCSSPLAAAEEKQDDEPSTISRGSRGILTAKTYSIQSLSHSTAVCDHPLVESLVVFQLRLRHDFGRHLRREIVRAAVWSMCTSGATENQNTVFEISRVEACVNEPATAYLSLHPLGKFRIRLVPTRHKTVPVRLSILAKLQVISESSIAHVSAEPRKITHHKPATTP